MSPRGLTDFSLDRLFRRDVPWIKTLECYLWRDHFPPSTQAYVASVFLSDATRYLAKATVMDPLNTLGALTADGEGWTVPAGWDGLTVVADAVTATTSINRLRATNVNAGGGANGGNIQNVLPIDAASGAREQFASVELDAWGPPFVDTIHRYGGVVLCTASDGSSYYGCIAEYGPAAGGHWTTIYRYSGGTRTDLAKITARQDMWNGVRLYAETAWVVGGLQITVRGGGPDGPIMAQAIDGTPLTGTYAGPTIFVGSGGNQVQVRTRMPIIGESRREYVGAVLTWGQMGDAIEATRPASAASSLSIDVSDAVAMVAREIQPTPGVAHLFTRFSALVNWGRQAGLGYDIGGSGLFVRWMPKGGILGVSNYLLSSPDAPADDILAYAARFDAWKATDRDVVTLQSTSPEGGAASIVVGQAAVGAIPVGLIQPLDFRSGFEEGSIAVHGTRDQYSVWSYVVEYGAAGSISIVSGFHGASQYALRFTCTATQLGGKVQKEYAGRGSGQPVYAKGLQRFPTLPTTGLMRLFEHETTGGASCRLDMLASGKLQLSNFLAGTTAQSATVFLVNQVFRWELRAETGTGPTAGIELRLYNADDRAPFETVVLPGGAAATHIGAIWYGDAGLGATGVVDLDDVGVSDHGWIGPGVSVIATPSSNAVVQWTPSAGANYDCVNDHPGTLNDADYISTATNGAVDQYGWTIPAAAAIPSGAYFYRVEVIARTPFAAGAHNVLLPVIWDESGTAVGGFTWVAGGNANPAGDQVTMYAAGGRQLATLQQWKIGIQYLAAISQQVSLLYANLEYQI